jgi:hypothetical protein
LIGEYFTGLILVIELDDEARERANAATSTFTGKTIDDFVGAFEIFLPPSPA